MTFQPGANVYTQGFGSRPENVEVPHLDVRAPATTDILYPVGKVWVDQVNNASYTLTSFSTSGNVTSANWVTTGGGSGAVATLTGDSGTATPSGGNIKIAGTANQISTIASGSTVTLSLAGPYTPATYTAHGVLLGEGTSSIVATAAGTTGQVLIGSTGADPAFGALGVNSGLTAHGVLLGEGNSAIAATAVGATGQTLMGSTGADPGWTGSPSFSGSVTAGTGVTATTGDVTATAGNLVATAGNLNLNGAASKINLNVGTAASASAGTATLTTGTVTVATTAVTASSLIFVSYNNCTSALAASLSAPSGSISAGVHFVINSQDATDSTSTVNWWLIN